MKVGILGTGFGKYHAKLYQQIKEIESITIYGRNEDKLTELQEELKINTTSNVDDILADETIDLVDICLPNHLHKEYAIRAMKSGKDVFCETPVANTLDDAKAILAASKKYQRRVWINQFIKHEPPYQYLYNLIKNKTYGSLKALNIRRKTPPMWGDLGFKQIATNLMIHELDFVSWFIDDIQTLNVLGVEHKEGQSHVDVLFNSDETIVEVQASSMMPESHPFTVAFEALFEDATLEYFEDGYIDRTEEGLRLYTNNESKEIKLDKNNCYEEAIKEVIRSYQTEQSSRLDIHDAIRSLKLALEIKNKLLI